MTSFLAWLLVFLSKRFVSVVSTFLLGKIGFLRVPAKQAVLKHVLYLTNALALPPSLESFLFRYRGQINQSESAFCSYFGELYPVATQIYFFEAENEKGETPNE